MRQHNEVVYQAIDMNKDEDDDKKLKEYQLNIDMWKHYDTLRQSKNQIFLAANTFLAAAIGFALQQSKSNSTSISVNVPVSLLGLTVCILWFLLLSRNAAYIRFHQSRVRSLERESTFSTFSEEWNTFKRELMRWESLSSNLIDRSLAVSFGIFWIAILVYFH